LDTEASVLIRNRMPSSSRQKGSYTQYDTVNAMLMGDILSVRLDKELESKLELLMKRRKIIDKSAYVRQLISKSLTRDLVDYLAEEVKARRMSAWRAADMAGVSLRTMLRELAERDVPMLDDRALEEDLRFVEGE